MPNKYPISQYYQPFNLTFTITEWHKHVTALSTHKKWMIKITDQAVYKEGGWEWVRGKKKKKKSYELPISFLQKTKRRTNAFESITKYTIKFSLCTMSDNTIDTSSFQ